MEKKLSNTLLRFFITYATFLLSLFLLPQTVIAKQVGTDVFPASSTISTPPVSNIVAGQSDDYAASTSLFISKILIQKERVLNVAHSIKMLKCMYEQYTQDKHKCLPHKHLTRLSAYWHALRQPYTYHQRYSTNKATHPLLQLRI